MTKTIEEKVKELANQSEPANLEKAVNNRYKELLNGLHEQVKRGNKRYIMFQKKEDSLNEHYNLVLIDKVIEKAKINGFYATLKQKMVGANTIINYIIISTEEIEEKDKTDIYYHILAGIIILGLIILMFGQYIWKVILQ